MFNKLLQIYLFSGFLSAVYSISSKEGIKGLWRGSSTSIPRVGVGSASQLFTFSKSKDWLDHYEVGIALLDVKVVF